MATLGQLFGGGVPRTEIIGVRILALVEGTIDTNGKLIDQFEASVTVNALASDSLSDVMARAVAYIDSGNLGSRRGRPVKATTLEADAIQVYYGGYDDPTIHMA